MSVEKNNLADLLQANFGQELSIHSRETLLERDEALATENDFPYAATLLLKSWRDSFSKIGTTSGYSQSIRSDATRKFLGHSSVDKNFVIANMTFSTLLAVVLIVWQVVGSEHVATKISYSCFITLIYGTVSWVIFEANKVSSLYKQTDKLRGIIFEIVDNSAQLQDIYARTPRPWRDLFLGSPPQDLEGTARLVAWNLDWYIKRPGSHFRSSWFIGVIVIVCMLGLILDLVLDYNSLLWLIIGVFSLLIVHSLESWRKLTGLALLIEETKRIFLEAEKSSVSPSPTP